MTDGGVDERDGGDDDGVPDLADGSGDDRGGEQDADQPAAEPVQQAQPLRSADRSGQFVGFPGVGPSSGVRGGRATCRNDCERAGHVGGVASVGVRLRGPGTGRALLPAVVC